LESDASHLPTGGSELPLLHRFSWRNAAVCLKLVVDRTWLADCKNVEIPICDIAVSNIVTHRELTLQICIVGQ
jgi:hypothetical protein